MLESCSVHQTASLTKVGTETRQAMGDEVPYVTTLRQSRLHLTIIHLVQDLFLRGFTCSMRLLRASVPCDSLSFSRRDGECTLRDDKGTQRIKPVDTVPNARSGICTIFKHHLAT